MAPKVAELEETTPPINREHDLQEHSYLIQGLLNFAGLGTLLLRVD